MKLVKLFALAVMAINFIATDATACDNKVKGKKEVSPVDHSHVKDVVARKKIKKKVDHSHVKDVLVKKERKNKDIAPRAKDVFARKHKTSDRGKSAG